MSLFDGLITSKMRVRIIMRLFLNPDQKSYIRELADEMHVSSSQVSDELKKLTTTGLLDMERKGRQINYSANQNHPLYPELHSMVKKALGMDHVIDSIIERVGDLELAYIIDDYAEGKDTGLIDLALIGKIDKANLQDLVEKAEKYLNRKIRTLVMDKDDFEKLKPMIDAKPNLLLWKSK